MSKLISCKHDKTSSTFTMDLLFKCITGTTNVPFVHIFVHASYHLRNICKLFSTKEICIDVNERPRLVFIKAEGRFVTFLKSSYNFFLSILKKPKPWKKILKGKLIVVSLNWRWLSIFEPWRKVSQIMICLKIKNVNIVPL